MANEIKQIAEKNGMTVEFVTWFFIEKKAACGSFWLMMMAAMWEGWKGRDSESTAALATIEKCREIVDCPAGIDLQDHLRQLAAENVGLKAACGGNGSYRDCPACAFSEYVEAPETPATDAYLAGIKADAFEEAAVELERVDTIASTRVIAFRLREFAKALSEGAK